MRGTRGTSPPFFIATRGHHSRKETKRKKKQHVDLRVLVFTMYAEGDIPWHLCWLKSMANMQKCV